MSILNTSRSIVFLLYCLLIKLLNNRISYKQLNCISITNLFSLSLNKNISKCSIIRSITSKYLSKQIFQPAINSISIRSKFFSPTIIEIQSISSTFHTSWNTHRTNRNTCTIYDSYRLTIRVRYNLYFVAFFKSANSSKSLRISKSSITKNTHHINSIRAIKNNRFVISLLRNSISIIS